MIVIRKRLIFWLIKAYLKKSKKILFFSFIAGLLIFFAIIFGERYLRAILTFERKPVIGMIGSYQRENLPDEVVGSLSRGLTKINHDLSIESDLAEKFEIEENGKVYKFTLKKNEKFNDGSELEAKSLTYQFTDVKIDRPNDDTIVFTLSDPYAPFLATVSKPVFKKGYVGVGDYNLRDIELNGSFVQELVLSKKSNRFETVKYVFYPTEEALKTAFALGEVTEARGITDISFKNISFDKYPRTNVTNKTSYNSLVTMFYNTNDSVLSDRKVRLGLGYAIPGNIPGGETAQSPYPPKSMYYSKTLTPRKQDLERARILIPEEGIKIKIKSLRKYKKTAELIAKEWEKIGVKSEIEEVDQVPDQFQVFLGDFNVPSDPDQYPLWHSDQASNITRFKNLRIDKLLEDGRKTTNINDRKKIYNDFQRFLLEEMPATFLYFPKEYTLKRN
jgi:peptide/nickel transport system substrate-binding protein